MALLEAAPYRACASRLEAAPFRACTSRLRNIFDSGFALQRLCYAGTCVAIAVALTISAPSPASAQAGGAAPAAAPAQGGRGAGAGGGGGQGGGRGGRGAGAPLYTPAAGAKDLKAVLFNWAWYTGMLRSSEEYDLIMSLEYQGKGTMQVDGQPCNVTKYRTSISYQTSGERIQITGTRPNGQSCSNVEVLSGAYTWNEDIPGAELVAGKGKATPMPATVEERMIRLWASPQGALKAAFAGTSRPASNGTQTATAYQPMS